MDKPLRYASLFIILFIALAIRLPNLEQLPHWYWDEGVNMNIAWNLINGRALWFSMRYPFMPHPPLFFIMGGILLRLFGEEIGVMRTLSVTLGILTTILIYLLVREFPDKGAGKFSAEMMAMLSALLFAIYPVAIYWNRTAFANNQLTLLFLLTMYSFRKYVQKRRWTNMKAERWLYSGSLFTGLAMITELSGFVLLPSIFIILRNHKAERVKAILLSLIPPALFFAVMLALMPREFVHDTIFTLKRFGITLTSVVILSLTSILIYLLRAKIIGILIRLKNLYTHLAYESLILPRESKLPPDRRENIAKRRLRSNAILLLILINLIPGITLIPPFNDNALFGGVDYFSIGILGLFMIRAGDTREFLLAFFLPLFIYIFFLTGRTDHLIIPLLPFLCIGLAIFLKEIHDYLKLFHVHSLTILLLLSYPFAFVLYHDASSFILGEGLVSEDIKDRIGVAEFINSRVEPDDIVITDSHMVRFIRCRASVLLQSIAAQGRGIAYMASDYGPERFEFDPSYGNARFIVITPKATEWLSENDKEMLSEIQRWPTRGVGGYIVYENPIKAK